MNLQEQYITDKVNRNLKIVNDTLNWVNSSSMRKTDKENTYDYLVSMRRKFNRIKTTFSDNPAAVMYGQSQVGKSYLVNSLLSQGGNFKVLDELHGVSYDFLEEINPVGGGAEATSLVTRFSANYTPLNPQYPIKIKLMSPADIILTLSDSYYEDATNHPPFENIEEKISAFTEKYALMPPLNNQAIIEDDVLYIEEYFEKYFTSKVRELTSTKFFKIVSRHISKMPPNEWADVFSILWHGKKELTDIFRRLIRVYQSINFSDVCYAQYDIVLRKYGTILDVTRLKEILGTVENIEKKEILGAVENIKEVPELKKEANVLYISNGVQKTVAFNKSELCALAYELVFKVNEDLKTDKKFLNYMDILDFPGARSRLKNQAKEIESNNIPDMLLRGKIAYLFNKYSDSFLISNLLLCHHYRALEARFMPVLLNNWICNFIGSTPEKRELFIKDSGVPPLFVIGTFFNEELQYNSTNDKTRASLISRWEQRFNKIWEGEVFTTKIKEGAWFNDWTTSNEYFNNIFMLRDFVWSERRHVYSGYQKTGTETPVPVEGWTHGCFMDDLKESFVNFQFVKDHFDDPSASWDDAATPGNDGTEAIIKKLTIAANNLEKSRTQKFKRDLDNIIKSVYRELKENHFHDDDADLRIVEKIKKAGKIQLELDVAFGKDPYFFGKLMQKFLLKESFIYNYYLEKMNDIQLIEQANLSEYVAIRMANPELKHSDPVMDREALFDYNLSVLQAKYKVDDAEKLKEYFEEKGIDLEELFFGETNVIKSNSVILAEGLVEKWTEEVLNIDRFGDFITQGFSERALADLLDNIKLLFEQLEITKLIAKHIRMYVDRYDQIYVILEMIADISAEIINNFVNHMGFEHYSDDKMKNIRMTDEQNNIGLVFDHNFLNFQTMEVEDRIKLFETLDRLPEILNQRPLDVEALKNVPNFSQYVKWSDLIRIAFVATCNIPAYNVEDNDKLRTILERLEQSERETENESPQ
jgi:hypothetical protein